MSSLLSYTALLALGEEGMRARIASGPQEAARVIQSAALSGVPAAMVQWGQMLVDGVGAARDPHAGLRWFRMAAEAGYADGVNMVGRCHELGWGTAIDHAEAAKHYARAAAAGHAWARFNLATLMLNGLGVPRDPRGALALFVASMRGGNPKAMNMLGRYREEGWANVTVNLDAAGRWYRRAAERGCFRGQFHCGRFALGRGEIAEAVAWFERSLSAAPEDFRREAADMLAGHANGAIREVGQAALARGHARA